MSERRLLLLLAVIVAVGSVATNLYIPALPAVRAYFGASVVEVQATFSVSLVTFAIGILTWGPVSDRFGRRRAILLGMSIVMLGATLGLTARSLPWLVAGRAIQAFGTATGITVARAIISDRFPVAHMAKAMAQLAIISVLTNGLAPVFGGYLAAGLGWRAVFGALIVAASVPTFLAWRHLPETRPASMTPPAAREMAGAVRALLTNPLYMSCALQTTAAYAIFLVFISLMPYVMVSALGRPPTEYGLYYLFVVVGYAAGNWLVGRLAARRSPQWMVVVGASLQTVTSAIALLCMAAGLRHPLWMFVPIGVLYLGQGLFMPNMSAIAVAQAPEHAGVASSTLGFLQQIVAALCVQLMGVTPTDTAVPVLAFGLAASLLQMLVLWLSPRIEAGAHRPAR
ncbi:MAG TPA: multidrug effflux MFS transporter [Steroidobacteraceae bacterium]|nr:multidrug effflux MFS transporter [Steroidobacteraceae bacterium]